MASESGDQPWMFFTLTGALWANNSLVNSFRPNMTDK